MICMLSVDPVRCPSHGIVRLRYRTVKRRMREQWALRGRNERGGSQPGERSGKLEKLDSVLDPKATSDSCARESRVEQVSTRDSEGISNSS